MEINGNQILTFARDNLADEIRQICKMRVDPSFTNRVGQSALHIGNIWGSVEAVKALLECKANPNLMNLLAGSTPLHAAALGKGPIDRRAECVKLLVHFKASPKLSDRNGDLPMDLTDDEELRAALGAMPLVLHKAVEKRDLVELQSVIEQVTSGKLQGMNLEAVNPQGETALHAAAARPFAEGVECLLAAGSKVSPFSNMRQTPLHLAVQVGESRICEMLLGAKANVKAKNADADHDPRFSSTTFQETPTQHRTALHCAAELGNVCIARRLLQARADPNARDSKQCTPLHLCMSLRDSDRTIEVGCGVRATSLSGRPEWNGRLGAVFGTLAPEADAEPGRWPVLLDTWRDTVAESIMLKEEEFEVLSGAEMVDLLLAAGADVNLGNQVMGETRTSLHEAARTGDDALLQKVLDARAAVNQQDMKSGFSALHLAARSKSHNSVALLVQAKADLKQVSSTGQTAAELAEKNRASAATLALLRGEDTEAGDASSAKAQTLDDLSPEQRAALFLD